MIIALPARLECYRDVFESSALAVLFNKGAAHKVLGDEVIEECIRVCVLGYLSQLRKFENYTEERLETYVEPGIRAIMAGLTEGRPAAKCSKKRKTKSVAAGRRCGDPDDQRPSDVHGNPAFAKQVTAAG
jgi:hypothetical protein